VARTSGDTATGGLLRGPKDWRARSRRLYPLSVTTLSTRPDPRGRLWWHLAYFPAVARGSAAALLGGVVVPVACVALSLALPLTEDVLPTLAIFLLALAAGFGTALAPSLAGAYLLRRPYWQPGAISLMTLCMTAGIPLSLGAQTLADAGWPSAATRDALEWLALHGMFTALGSTTAAIIWLPVGLWMFKRRGVPFGSR
jgi:hypothetical protein